MRCPHQLSNHQCVADPDLDERASAWAAAYAALDILTSVTANPRVVNFAFIRFPVLIAGLQC